MDQNLSQVILEPSEPTPQEARSFALMITHGLPALDAMVYFFPNCEDAGQLQADCARWMRSSRLKTALKQVQGGEWHELSPAAQIEFAINKHYSELAYYLYANNYSDLVGQERTKADSCRTALEAKLAGTAGKLDPLQAFWDDIKTGRVKLTPQISPNTPQILPVN